MAVDLNFVGLVIPPDGATEVKVDEIGDIFINELTPLPLGPLNPVAVEQRLRDWLPSIDNNPALLRRLTSNLVYQAAANMPLFLSTLQNIEARLACICENSENPPDNRLTVVSTIVSRPQNISISFGAPGPDIVRAGWVLFEDSFGNVGQRSFIIADNQRHVADIPNAVSYTYHVETGFDVTFS